MAKVMVVDDSELMRVMLETWLTAMGHKVVIVTDGYSVLPAFNQHQPDLIVLDFQMPAASGAEVYGRLRGLDKGANLPVVFLSGMSRQDITCVVPETAHVRFLQKPIDHRIFQEIIREFLPETQPAPQPAPGNLKT